MLPLNYIGMVGGLALGVPFIGAIIYLFAGPIKKRFKKEKGSSTSYKDI
jgi:hypothetical protein